MTRIDDQGTAAPAQVPLVGLPAGFRLAADRSTRRLDESTLLGGSPTRAIRLSAAGVQVWEKLLSGPVDSAAAGSVARRLTDAGLAHPVPPTVSGVEVTVVIPVKDRADMLERCLAALGPEYPVVVVDDASDDPAALAAVCARHGAALIRREANGGPGPARDTGMSAVTTEFVAFLDSDCVPPPGWLQELAGHLEDPMVAAVAPRVTALPVSTWIGRYVAAAGSLDLGARPARVVPSTLVAYLPTAAILLRRQALSDVAVDGHVFDPALRYGEDVDLIWRLHEAGWRVRYDPAVQVQHEEPGSWRTLLARRARYGTSAAPLGRRHPDSMAPLILHPWVSAAAAAVLLRRPAPALLCYCTAVLRTRKAYRTAGLSPNGAQRQMADAVGRTLLGTGRYATQFGAPVLAAVLLGRPARSRAWSAAAGLLLAPPLADWISRRPALDPVRFGLARVADDIAYGIGVMAGCVRARDASVLRPRVAWRPLRSRTTRSIPSTPDGTSGPR